MAEALTILGYKDVHHGITAGPRDWPLIEDACDALFPVLPSYNGKRMTRTDWDRIFGPCEAVTDMGSFFALELIKSYPEAKVILVERDVETWYRSFEEAIVDTTWGWRADFFSNLLAPLFGGRTGLTIRKILLGFFEARDVAELRACARGRYLRHYAEVRAAVPPGRLLDLDLREGWAPLCEFLELPVPDVSFPRSNRREVHLARVKRRQSTFLKSVLVLGVKRAMPWAFGLVAVAIGYGAYRRPGVVQQLADKVRWVLFQRWKHA